MYVNNTRRSLDIHLVSVLQSKKCPIRVYKDIWLFVPHSNDKFMLTLKENLVKKLILTCGLKSDRIYKIIEFTGNYMNIIELIQKMVTSKEFRKTIQDKRIIPVGPYCQLRGLLHSYGYLKSSN